MGLGIEASRSLRTEELSAVANGLRVRAIAFGDVVASVTTKSHSESANVLISIASSNSIAVAFGAAQERSASVAAALRFDGGAAGLVPTTRIGVVAFVVGCRGDWAELSVLRAAGLVSGIVTLVGFGTVPLACTT